MKQNLAKLMESELEKAEIILAAKDLANEVQSMVEDVAKMRAEELLSLIDRMKEVFGAGEAEKYESAVSEKLTKLQDALTNVKDGLTDAALTLNGEGPPESDMVMDLDSDPMAAGDDLDSELPPEPGADDDFFGAADSAEGGDEPLGRARKESINFRRRKVLESKIRLLKRRLAENKSKKKSVTEVSNKLLGRYIKKAARDSARNAFRAGDLRPENDEKGEKAARKVDKRHKGIDQAVDKLRSKKKKKR